MERHVIIFLKLANKYIETFVLLTIFHLIYCHAEFISVSLLSSYLYLISLLQIIANALYRNHLSSPKALLGFV